MKWFSVAIATRSDVSSTLRSNVVPLRLTPTMKIASGSERDAPAAVSRGTVRSADEGVVGMRLRGTLKRRQPF
jgi:hypothetical protein